MKKQLLCSLALFVLLISELQAMTCLDKLMPYSRYSGAHQLHIEEWDDGQESVDAKSALKAFESLIGEKLMCRENEVVIKLSPVCQMISSGLKQSQVCFLFTNLGHVIISKDKGKNTNFVFTRDNQFADSKPTLK